jgi:hypothetical protein
MYSKARGRMSVSGRAWHTGVGVDNCKPPRPLMGRTRTRTRIPLAYVGSSNFKLKFQYYGSSPGFLLRLMFVYTTSDIYLTLRNKTLKFVLNFRKYSMVIMASNV